MAVLGFTEASLAVVVVVIVLVFVRVHLLEGGRIQACDFGLVPLSVFSASDSRDVSLDEAFFTVISNHRVDLVTWLHAAVDLSVLYERRLTAGHCALLTGEGQVVVAGHIVPLSALMPDHDHTVLAGGEEAVRLTITPVLELHGMSISPAEIIVKHFIIQADPLIVVAQTIYEELLFVGQDAGQVSALQTTLSFCCLPRPPVGEVLIAVALKLLPTKVTNLRILLTEGS